MTPISFGGSSKEPHQSSCRCSTPRNRLALASQNPPLRVNVSSSPPQLIAQNYHIDWQSQACDCTRGFCQAPSNTLSPSSCLSPAACSGLCLMRSS